MKDEKLISEILNSAEASSILLAINFKREAKITDISKLTRMKSTVLGSTMKKLEEVHLVKSEESVFSVNWEVLMPELLNSQKNWIWEFERFTYKFLPQDAAVTPGRLDEIVRNMTSNTYLKDFYQSFLSLYFEFAHDTGKRKSIFELMIEDFFDYLLPRYYKDIQSSISAIVTSEKSDFENFKEFLDIAYKVASRVHKLEGSAFKDAIDLSSPIFLENLVVDELEKRGFEITPESTANDSRLDLLADLNGKKIGIELKAYDRSVIPAQVIENLGKSRANLDELILITSANLSNEAIEVAEKLDVRIITVDKIGHIGRILKARDQKLRLIPHILEKDVKEFGESFKEVLERTKNATTNDEKKKSLEDLAEIIVKQIDGLEVLDRNLRSSAEEIDLLVGNESKEIFWVRLGSPILLECKNWAVPVGSKEIRDFAGKMESTSVTTGILVTPSGVTGDEFRDARLKIRENRQKGRHIVVIENEDLLEIANGIHPSDKIREKYYEIFKI